MNITKVLLIFVCFFFVESLSADPCFTLNCARKGVKEAGDTASTALKKARDDTEKAAIKAREDTEKAAIKAREDTQKAVTKAWEDTKKAAIKARVDTQNAIQDADRQMNATTNAIRNEERNRTDQFNAISTDINNRSRSELNNIENTTRQNIGYIQEKSQQQIQRATEDVVNTSQQLDQYVREHPVDKEGLESAFSAAAAAAKNNLGKSTKQFGTQVKKTIKDVESSEPAKALNNLGTRASMENIKHGVSKTVEYLDDSEAGSSLDEVGRNVSIGSIKKGIKNTGDYWNSTEPINAVGGLAAKVKPSIEKIGEGIGNIDKAQEKALEDLRQFDPEEIFGWVQQSIKENIDDELKRNGLAFNQETGELDLRNSRMGKTLLNWLEKFTQGNNAEEGVKKSV